MAIGRLGSLKTSSTVGINTFALLYTSPDVLTNVSINVTNQGFDDATFSVGICTNGLAGIRNSDYIVLGQSIKSRQYASITNVGVSSNQTIFCLASEPNVGFIAYGVQDYKQGVATFYGKEDSLKTSLAQNQINTPIALVTSSRKSSVTLVVTNKNSSDRGYFSVGISSGGLNEFSSADYIIFGRLIERNETCFVEKITLGVNQSLIIQGSIKDLIFSTYSLPADPSEDAFPSQISVSVATTITAYGQQTDTYGFYGNVIGNVTGNVIGLAHTGNLTGNINSSGVSTFSGGILGNITGNVTGNVSGQVYSTGISTFGSVIVGTPDNQLIVNNNATITGQLTIGINTVTNTQVLVGDTRINPSSISIGQTTTSQRLTNPTPPAGTITFNNTTGLLEYYNGTSWVSAGTFSDIDISSNSNSLSWQRLWVNTTSGAVTVTLPLSPYKGDTIKFFDVANTFNTNNLTVSRNGQLINGDADDLVVAIQGASFDLVYSGATYGWRIFSV